MEAPSKIKEALNLLMEIEKLGYEAYIVGGAVRDMLIGREVVDVDIATNCPVKILEKEFTTYDIGRSKDFGICGVMFNGTFYEVAQFRVESDYNGRYPAQVKIASSIKEDLLRRDFTINALALSSNVELIDFVGGKKDLDNTILRAVGNPIDRFTEDYLRMIRAARFAALGFDIERNTKTAIRKLSKHVRNITPERIRLELKKAADYGAKEFAKFIIHLDNLRLLDKILPEVSTLKYFHHNRLHHPEGITVFDHIIKCLEVAMTNDFMSLIAILLHDIGKAVTLSEEGGVTHYYRHERYSTLLAKDILERYKFTNYEKDIILFAIKNHMKFNKIHKMKASKVAKLVEDKGFDTLVEVAWADEFSRGETFCYYGTFDQKVRRAYEIAKKVQVLKTKSHKKDIIDGYKIMNVCGIKPGPLVGKIKQVVTAEVLDKNIDIQDEEVLSALILENYKKLKGGN